MVDVLLVEDDKLLCETLKELLGRKNLSVSFCYSMAEARQLITEPIHTDLVLLDVHLPDGDGLELVAEFKKIASSPEVIIMTGKGDPDGAELAIQNGAWSYLEKTSLFKQLPSLVDSALEYHKEKLEAICTEDTLSRGDIVGSCEQMMRCYYMACQASRSDINVLLTGESGTGKEVFAQAIHNNSARRDGKLVVVDCATLPDTLAESILFGHVKGAFTDAKSERKGLVQEAHMGTLFLDEVGELPEKLQKTFLRVLQEKRFRPIGHTEEVHSDFRLIAATNKDLHQRMDEGEFRKDLYFRLRALSIKLPPLRERGNDIMKLANYFLTKKYGTSTSGNRINFSHDFVEVLKTYSWPGNVRELFNALERAVASSRNFSTLYAQHLPEEIRVMAARKSVQVSKDTESSGEEAVKRPVKLRSWKEYKEEVERKYLQDLLSEADSNIPQACQISGLSRARLYQLINKHSPEKQSD